MIQFTLDYLGAPPVANIMVIGPGANIFFFVPPTPT